MNRFAWLLGRHHHRATGSEVTSRQVATKSEADFVLERLQMVAEQLCGPDRNITDPLVLAAMKTVPRHEFVPKSVRSRSYLDRPLPIGQQQTISQPYIVAYMTEQLGLAPNDRVLEVGTGSGYQAAVLAEIAAQVFTIELIEEFAHAAAANLQRLGYRNVRVRDDDGYLGWPEAAPFDAMIIACATREVPPPLILQLKEGGRMIIPVGDSWEQELVLLQKKGGKIHQQSALPVRFVPLRRRSGTALSTLIFSPLD